MSVHRPTTPNQHRQNQVATQGKEQRVASTAHHHRTNRGEKTLTVGSWTHPTRPQVRVTHSTALEATSDNHIDATDLPRDRLPDTPIDKPRRRFPQAWIPTTFPMVAAADTAPVVIRRRVPLATTPRVVARPRHKATPRVTLEGMVLVPTPTNSRWCPMPTASTPLRRWVGMAATISKEESTEAGVVKWRPMGSNISMLAHTPDRSSINGLLRRLLQQTSALALPGPSIIETIRKRRP